jgi:predicted MFS family arabinose efflux permease
VIAQRITERKSPRHAARVVTGTVTTTIASVIPAFLVGGLAVQIADELGLDPADLGLTIAVYFGVTAFAAIPVGRLVVRYGSRRTAQLAVVISAAGMVAIALAARSLLALVLLLAATGVANALGQLASNTQLAVAVPARRQGLTFGIKQAAIPLSTMLAGAAVPGVALTVGWRWAFGIAAALALCALPLVPPEPEQTGGPPPARGGRANAALVLIGIGAALAAAGANALSTFLVDSTESRGVDPGLAGLTLTLGSAICVAARILLGWLADRRSRGHLGVVALLYAVGGGGLALLSLHSPVALVLGVVLGFGLGWAWPGLQTFAVVRLHPQSPTTASSVIQTGVYAGACVGPLGLGWVATGYGYDPAWLVAGLALLLACVLVLLGARTARPRSAGAVGDEVTE